jgi:hypothetical protein
MGREATTTHPALYLLYGESRMKYTGRLGGGFTARGRSRQLLPLI